MAKILALDLSLTTAGVCRHSDTGYDHETVKVPSIRVPGAKIGTTKAAPRLGAERLCWWHGWLIEELTREVKLVAVEALAFSAPRLAEIAKLYGIVELTCHVRNIRMVYVPIKTIKKHATGSGESDKQRMIDTARDRFGDGISDEHTADAAWLCDYARVKLL